MDVDVNNSANAVYQILTWCVGFGVYSW